MALAAFISRGTCFVMVFDQCPVSRDGNCAVIESTIPISRYGTSCPATWNLCYLVGSLSNDTSAVPLTFWVEQQIRWHRRVAADVIVIVIVDMTKLRAVIIIARGNAKLTFVTEQDDVCARSLFDRSDTNYLPRVQCRS